MLSRKNPHFLLSASHLLADVFLGVILMNYKTLIAAVALIAVPLVVPFRCAKSLRHHPLQLTLLVFKPRWSFQDRARIAFDCLMANGVATMSSKIPVYDSASQMP